MNTVLRVLDVRRGLPWGRERHHPSDPRHTARGCSLAAGCLALLLIAAPGRAAGEPPASGTVAYRSHAPVRPLPAAHAGLLAAGPKLYADAARGNDANAGTAAAPWKTLAHALRRLKPGDTL